MQIEPTAAPTKTIDPLSKWRLTIVSAVIDSERKWDSGLFWTDDLPDSYIRIRWRQCGGSDKIVAAKIANSATPKWMTDIDQAYDCDGKSEPLTASRLMSGWRMEVRDDDGWGSEEIGTCPVIVESKDLEKGTFVVSGCPSVKHPGQTFVKEVQLTFTPL
jgi:hypothetical protein